MWSKIGRLISIGNSRGNPLGLFQVSLLDKQKIKLPRGSTLLLYSDGVTEANNEKDEWIVYWSYFYLGNCYKILENYNSAREAYDAAEDTDDDWLLIRIEDERKDLPEE